MPGPLEIKSVAVVMPAHNEDQHIGKALVALKAAADALQRDCPDVEARMVVVLDHCTDRSAEIAACACLRRQPLQRGQRESAKHGGQP